jgi:hypothetical protein
VPTTKHFIDQNLSLLMRTKSNTLLNNIGCKFLLAYLHYIFSYIYNTHLYIIFFVVLYVSVATHGHSPSIIRSPELLTSKRIPDQKVRSVPSHSIDWFVIGQHTRWVHTLCNNLNYQVHYLRRYLLGRLFQTAMLDPIPNKP